MVSMVQVMNRNFISSLKMMGGIIDVCPDNVWEEINGWSPFWQQIYHVLESVDYWFRENYNYVYDDEVLKAWKTDKNVTSELDENMKEFDDILSKAELRQYLNCIYQKTDMFFNSLDDSKLVLPIAENNFDFTYLDVIDMQIRHVMYHVGHCICILRSRANLEVEWISHNER